MQEKSILFQSVVKQHNEPEETGMTVFKLSNKPAPLCNEAFLLIKDKDRILYRKPSQTIFIQQDCFVLSNEEKANALFIGELNGKKIYALEKDGLENEEQDYLQFHGILDLLKPAELKAFYRSCHLLNWQSQSQYCGHCGSPTRIDDSEFARVCLNQSAHRHYPQYSPSMIVLVRYQNKLLLGRSAHFKPGMYSTLAGFIEAGETVEEAVRREVMEEVGIEVKNIRPIDTAPWPFPNTLMLAYEAEAVHDQLNVNQNELEDAQWFGYDNLPQLPPKATIAYQLIQRGVLQNSPLHE